MSTTGTRSATSPPHTSRFWMTRWRWRSGPAFPCLVAGRPTILLATTCPATSTCTHWVSWSTVLSMFYKTIQTLRSSRGQDFFFKKRCRSRVSCFSFIPDSDWHVALSSRRPVRIEDETSWPCVWWPSHRLPHCENHPARGSQVSPLTHREVWWPQIASAVLHAEHLSHVPSETSMWTHLTKLTACQTSCITRIWTPSADQCWSPPRRTWWSITFRMLW